MTAIMFPWHRARRPSASFMLMTAYSAGSIAARSRSPFTASKGYLFDVAPRLSYCMENTGTEPVVFYRSTPAGQVPSYPESETPTPVKGYHYDKAKITSTGGYEGVNQPFLDFNAYASGGGKSRDFAYDG